MFLRFFIITHSASSPNAKLLFCRFISFSVPKSSPPACTYQFSISPASSSLTTFTQKLQFFSGRSPVSSLHSAFLVSSSIIVAVLAPGSSFHANTPKLSISAPNQSKLAPTPLCLAPLPAPANLHLPFHFTLSLVSKS